MQDYILNEYLDRIGILSEDQEDIDHDQDNFLLHEQPYSSSLDQLEEPGLHPYPFELDKEESTREKTEERTEDVLDDLDEEPRLEVKANSVVNYLRTFQGSKDDTMELSINFKTLLMGYFRQLIFLNELQPKEIQHFQKFAKQAPSLSSIVSFYAPAPCTKNIRERSLEFWEGADCIRRIMKGRSRLRTKLMMVKFVEKMRMNLLSEGQVVRWKDNPRWKEKFSYVDRTFHFEREKPT